MSARAVCCAFEGQGWTRARDSQLPAEEPREPLCRRISRRECPVARWHVRWRLSVRRGGSSAQRRHATQDHTHSFPRTIRWIARPVLHGAEPD